MIVPQRADLVTEASARLIQLLAVADAHQGAQLGEAYLGRTTEDVLSHLVGWHELFESWIRQQRAGVEVHFPAQGYTWESLAELNTAIFTRWQGTAASDVRSALLNSHARMLDLVAGFTDDELSDPDRHPWTGGEPLASVAHECLAAHYEWALATFASAGLTATADDDRPTAS